uniref:Uncharacterized protein LOC111127080 n=1 Tax=Crassostrea virginica TaxID=6565 RepID=A0A8B8DJN3_CRAVI|nr:uncharacterized protein LOC111127080 [Crassostrea virginica]
MEGLYHLSYDCGFNSYYNGSTCVPCQNGFYGNNCADQCSPGLYGFMCANDCRCPFHQCNHIYGCPSGIKDTSTSRGDVLTSGSYNSEVHVPISVNKARGSTGSYNTGTSAPMSSNDPSCTVNHFGIDFHLNSNQNIKMTNLQQMKRQWKPFISSETLKMDFI